MNKALKGIIILVLGLVFIIILGTIFTAGKNAETSVQPSQSPLVSPQVYERVTAQEIADDFDTNAVSAKQKWNNRKVEFEAQITNITDNGLQFSSVASKQFSVTSITCKVDDEKQLLPLKNGQDIVVKGTVNGQSFGIIEIKDCEVVS